ncbi:hypothetical protein DJ74_13435 [Halorubrum sp. Ea8]|nr:hypothetical protein DJ74_13435 [Halorubrum sp. Ea8]
MVATRSVASDVATFAQRDSLRLARSIAESREKSIAATPSTRRTVSLIWVDAMIEKSTTSAIGRSGSGTHLGRHVANDGRDDRERVQASW